MEARRVSNGKRQRTFETAGCSRSCTYHTKI
jgi:hypothetical protein